MAALAIVGTDHMQDFLSGKSKTVKDLPYLLKNDTLMAEVSVFVTSWHQTFLCGKLMDEILDELVEGAASVSGYVQLYTTSTLL